MGLYSDRYDTSSSMRGWVDHTPRQRGIAAAGSGLQTDHGMAKGRNFNHGEGAKVQPCNSTPSRERPPWGRYLANSPSVLEEVREMTPHLAAPPHATCRLTTDRPHRFENKVDTQIGCQIQNDGATNGATTRARPD